MINKKQWRKTVFISTLAICHLCTAAQPISSPDIPHLIANYLFLPPSFLFFLPFPFLDPLWPFPSLDLLSPSPPLVPDPSGAVQCPLSGSMLKDRGLPGVKLRVTIRASPGGPKSRNISGKEHGICCRPCVPEWKKRKTNCNVNSIAFLVLYNCIL